MADNILADSPARHVEIDLQYNGKSISKAVQDLVTQFKYVDRAKNNEFDEISVTFQDVDTLWRSEWFPDLGSKFTAKINCKNWFMPDDAPVRDCGSFEIDDLTSNYPPSTFTISAISVGITNSIRHQEHTRAWEKFTPQSIASQIAQKNGFQLKFYSNYNPVLTRFDQSAESDLSFLKRVCEYCGMLLKAYSNQIIIWRQEEFDAQDPVLTIRNGQDGFQSASFKAATNDVYTSCEVTYWDSKKKELVKYIYKPDGISGSKNLGHRDGVGKGQTQTGAVTKKGKGKGGGGGGGTPGMQFDPITREPLPGKGKAAPTTKECKEKQIKAPDIGKSLIINRRCESLAMAEQVAKAALRGKNQQAVTGSMKFAGNPLLYSGMNIAIEGYGRWDTVVWVVEEVTHSYDKSSGYETSINIRGTLTGF